MEASLTKTGDIEGNAQLATLAILPNRVLGQQFVRVLSQSRAFQIVAEWTSYPSVSTLETHLRQSRPEALLIDVSTNLQQAAELIETISAFGRTLPVIALHVANDGEALLRCLRAGATEFLYPPFSVEMQRESVARISSLFPRDDVRPKRRGSLVVFSSTKPGSGASTIAAHAAFALEAVTSDRILLVDLALWSGTMRLLFKLPETPSLTDALRAVDANALHPCAETWSSLVRRKRRVDLLPSPVSPSVENPDPSKLRKILECARQVYDWVVVDLPTVFNRLSLLLLPESDHAFLVTTAELPSLHLTRKAVSLLGQMGLSLESFHVVVNRVGKADQIALQAMANVFKAPVYASFPNDYLSLHKALSVGEPLGPCSLERALMDFARSVCTQSQTGEGKKLVSTLKAG